MLDNIDIAILTRRNDLAARHGLKPYDFVATLKANESAGATLDFEVPASGNDLREERFGKMLDSLGVVPGDSAVLSGSYEAIVDALDTALDLAPRPRGRP